VVAAGALPHPVEQLSWVLVPSTVGPASAGGVGEGRGFLITQVTGKDRLGSEEGIKAKCL
jgi:hypothetical protein